MSEDLQERMDGAVAILTMNRPESLNSLSSDMMSGLLEAIPRLSADSNVGAIVLTGAGRGFCAGGDVKGMAKGHSSTSGSSESKPVSLEARANALRASMEISRFIHESSKPVIAQMRGPAAGAGLSLALACDIRMASDTIKLTTAFSKVGVSGDFGGSYFLTKIVGSAKARELFFTAAILKADEALRLGMVNHIFADDELEAKTMELAHQIANGPRIATEYMKKNLNASESGTLQQVFDMEAWHMTRTMLTNDHKEAAKAFVEKRAPSFTGS